MDNNNKNNNIYIDDHQLLFFRALLVYVLVNTLAFIQRVYDKNQILTQKL